MCHGDGSARSERWRPGASRRRLDVSARARISPDDNWYDAPSSSNFINVRSEDELRDVMRAAYGNARASTLLVVEFYAKWCNSCRRLYPRLCKLAAQEQDVLFVKIEFDECKDLCRKLGVVKLPYFHIYNGSGSRLADFAASLDPVKFRRLTDAIDANRGLRCAVPGKTNTTDPSTTLLPSLVKLHHVTFEWRGGGDDAMIVGDPSGGWTHTLALDAVNDPIDGGPTHAVTCILPTGTYRFKFIVDGEWRAEAAYPVVADADDNVNNEIFVGAASWPLQWVQVPGAAPPGPPGNASSVPVALDLAVPEPHVAERNGVGGSRARETLRRRSPPGAGSGSSGAGSGSSGAGSGSSGAGSGSSGTGRVADPRSAKPPSAKPNKSAMAAPYRPGWRRSRWRSPRNRRGRSIPRTSPRVQVDAADDGVVAQESRGFGGEFLHQETTRREGGGGDRAGVSRAQISARGGGERGGERGGGEAIVHLPGRGSRPLGDPRARVARGFAHARGTRRQARKTPRRSGHR